MASFLPVLPAVRQETHWISSDHIGMQLVLSSGGQS